MRLCVLSSKGASLDEGQRNIASAFVKELSKDHQILHLNAKESFRSPAAWTKIKDFRPDILHFFLRPNLSQFTTAKLFQIYLNKVPTVFSATQPRIVCSRYIEVLMRLFSPTCVTVLTEETGEFYKKLGIRTAQMQCGVDIEKFREPTGAKKEVLRRKYGFDVSIPIVLHVGHLTKGRNLDVLAAGINERSRYQLVLVASFLFDSDREVERLLREKGVIIIREYLAEIEELYQLADIYVFPTVSNSFCIDAPLSVFEAMATNIPVVTTRFGVLPKYFSAGEGLIYVDDPSEILAIAEDFLRAGDNVQTRKKVSGYTWQYAVSQMISIYKELADVR